MISAADAGSIAEAVPGIDLLTGSATQVYAVRGLRPDVVVKPRTVEAIADILRLANERRWIVAPRGGGTMLDLGNAPRSLDVVIDLGGMNQVLDYQPDDLTLTVEAGATIAAVQQLLRERGQTLPLDVPLPDRATVGGALAANASGPLRTRFGTARDLCIGMQVALADGSLARSGGKVVKNVAGYDLNKLHIGALGTVGIITEVTFKLWPAAEAYAGLIATFDSLAAAHGAAMALLNGRLFPAALEIAGPGAAGQIVPGNAFKPEAQHWLLAVLMLGSAAAVERQGRDADALCVVAGAERTARLDAGASADLFGRIRDFGRGEGSPAKLIVRAAVLPSETARAEIVQRLGERIGDPPEILCRPSAGLALGFWRERGELPIADAITAVRAELFALQGTLVMERAPDDLSVGLDVWGIQGPDLRLMQRLKEAYDPNRILNPGRFATGL